VSLEVKLIGSDLTDLIHDLRRYLKKSEAWTRGRASIDDIVRFLYMGQMHLWVVIDGSIVYGYVITEIKQYPQCKALVMQYCAGQPGAMAGIEDQMHDLLEQFARSAGCKIMEFMGRTGWKKVAKSKGYEARTMVYEKYLGDKS